MLESDELPSDLFLCQLQAFFPLSLLCIHLESSVGINTLHLGREKRGSEREGEEGRERERDGEVREREGERGRGMEK